MPCPLNNGLVTQGPISKSPFLIKENLPSENCILLDDKMDEITSDSNDYFIKFYIVHF